MMIEALSAENDPDEDDADTVSTVIVCRRSWGVFNLLYRLLGRRSVTRSWTRQKDPPLQFDFDALALCGVGLGRSLRKLSDLGLGPADEEFGEGNRYLEYDDLGLEVWASENEGIFCFALQWHDPDMIFWKSFPGKCLFRGREVRLSGHTRRDDVLEQFGPPAEVPEEEGSSWMSYAVRDGEFTFYFSDEGELISIDCTSG